MRTFSPLVLIMFVLFAQRAVANDYVYGLQSPWEALNVSQDPAGDVIWLRTGAAFFFNSMTLDAASIRAGAVSDGEDVDAGLPVRVCGQSAVRLTSIRHDSNRRARIVRQIVRFSGGQYLEYYADDDSTAPDPGIAAAMQHICDEHDYLRAAPPPGWFAVRRLGLWPGDGWTNYLRLSATGPAQLDAIVEAAFADLSFSGATRHQASAPIQLCAGMSGRLLTALVRPEQGGDFIVEELAAVSSLHGWLLEYLRPKDRIEDSRAVAALRGFCAQ